MSRKLRFFLVAALLVVSGAMPAWSMARRSEGLTMLVVPVRYSVLQVSFDLLQRRDAVLLAYQGDATTDRPLLYAWNGREWIHVPIESFQDASFLQIMPHQIVLIGDESMVPPVLIEGSTWCPLVMSIPGVDTPTLVNSFGKLFGFRRSDWQWFSSRYHLDLMDLNEGRRKTSWYDQPYVSARPSPMADETPVAVGDKTTYDAEDFEPAEVRYEESVPDTTIEEEAPMPAVEPEASSIDDGTESTVEESDAVEGVHFYSDEVPAAAVVLEPPADTEEAAPTSP